MGSMGLLLADWSVELFRARRKKAKKAKMMEKMERVEEITGVLETIGEVGNTEKIVGSREAETSTGDGFLCLACEKGVKALDEAQLAQEETAKGQERLGQLVGVDPGDLVAAVEQLVAKAAHLRTELEQLRAESGSF